MGDQIQGLQLFFRRKEVDISDDEGDDNSNNKYWEFQNLEEVEAWSIALVPMTEFLHFQAKFRTSKDAMPISPDEKVKDVMWYVDNTLLIHCETTASPPYFFTICVNNSASSFSTLYFLRSLNDLVYKPLMKEVEREIDNKAWQSKDSQPLRARPVVGKVRRLLQSIATMTAANQVVASAIMPLTLNRGRNTHCASEDSACNVLSQRLTVTRAELSTNHRNSKRPSSAITSTPSASQRKCANVQGLPEASTTSAITQVPSELEPGQEFDYAEIANIYNKFWTECQSCFVFGVEEKHEVNIDQLERAPEDWTVRAYEEHGMEKLKHYLINMPDRTARQTLCIMSQTKEKPTSFRDIEDGNFWIINGQHSVDASKTIQDMDVPHVNQVNSTFGISYRVLKLVGSSMSSRQLQ